MRALTWHGRHDVRVDTVPDPTLLNPRDAIVEVTTAAICGSDLHLYDHDVPTVRPGDILGHEFMGRVVAVGRETGDLRLGERVVVPCVIACGRCFYCGRHQFAACDNANPADTAELSEKLYGYSMPGTFGYSQLTGGYSGGQAEFVRVPFADVGPVVIPDGLDDERVLFLSDILPAGWMAAENCEIEPGDTVAVWGAGPVGLFAMQAALKLGAYEVIAIDRHPHRLALASGLGATPLHYEESPVQETLLELTGGMGPDACIDAVGLESHGWTLQNVAEQVKSSLFLGADRPDVLRQIIFACRKGGRISIPGVYGGTADKFPIGALMEKGLTVRSGQTHVQKYTARLLQMVADGELDTTFLISHRMALDDAPQAYKIFKEQQNEVTKVILKPKHAHVPRADLPVDTPIEEGLAPVPQAAVA